ncbi:MAG: hypothetical protein K8S98_06540 [Planctomycetes bacterium]|nr:hypothetical protein [Planctomycetota bacterium]
MRAHQLVTAILVILLLAAIVRSPLHGRQDDGAPAEPTPLGLVRASPDAYLGKEVSFVVQVHTLPTSWNPYLTRFGITDFRALSVWADEQALWVTEEFGNPFGPVFARRGTSVDTVFAQAKPYERYLLKGRVREVFLGRPWIEVDAATHLDGEVGEGTILHAGRALQLVASGQPKLALEDFDRALAGDLPPKAREALEELRRDCAEPPAKKTR